MKKAFDQSFLPPPSSQREVKGDMSTPEITLLPKATGNLQVNKGGDMLPIHKMNPVIAVLSEVTSIIDSVSTAITQISVEKQRTAQVRAQADAFKTQQYEMTNRTKIEQEEETKRVKQQAAIEIMKIEKEWKVEKQRLKLQIKELEKSQKQELIVLGEFEKAVKVLLKYQHTLVDWYSGEMDKGIYDEKRHQEILEISSKIQHLLETMKGQ